MIYIFGIIKKVIKILFLFLTNTLGIDQIQNSMEPVWEGVQWGGQGKPGQALAGLTFGKAAVET